jgi:hypothetical protein
MKVLLIVLNDTSLDEETRWFSNGWYLEDRGVEFSVKDAAAIVPKVEKLPVRVFKTVRVMLS